MTWVSGGSRRGHWSLSRETPWADDIQSMLLSRLRTRRSDTDLGPDMGGAVSTQECPLSTRATITPTPHKYVLKSVLEILKNLHSISCFKNLLRIFVEFADFPSLKRSQIDLIHSSSVTQHQPGRASNKIRSVSVTTKLVHSHCSIFTQPIPGEFLRQISEIWSALSSHIHMAL